jgi:hypothetical protein
MTDQALLSEIQYALVEPPDGGQSFPSEVWTRSEVLEAVNGGERSLLRETHLLVTRTELPVGASQITVDLPATWLATVAMAWRTTVGVRTPILPADSFEIDTADPTWESAGVPVPFVYLDTDRDTLTFRLGPAPTQAGTVELLYVAVPAAVNGNGRSFTVPDDYIAGIKYDALGWLLGKVGRLQDPQRAAYCRRRQEMAVIAAELVLSGRA